jgi:hypothetical protein
MSTPLDKISDGAWSTPWEGPSISGLMSLLPAYTADCCIGGIVAVTITNIVITKTTGNTGLVMSFHTKCDVFMHIYNRLD